MSVQNNSNFIPKKSPKDTPVGINRGKVIGIFGYVSYTLFFGSLIISVGMYILSFTMYKNLVEAQEELIDIKNDINQNKMHEFTKIDEYLRKTEDVFKNSYSIMPLFQVFEQITAEPVVVTNFTVQHKDEHLNVSLQAVADTIETTIYQRQIALEQNLLSNGFINEVNLVQVPDDRLATAGSNDFFDITNDYTVDFKFETQIDLLDLPLETVANVNSIQRSVPETRTRVIETDLDFLESAQLLPGSSE